jgi:hypothetical protein
LRGVLGGIWRWVGEDGGLWVEDYVLLSGWERDKLFNVVSGQLRFVIAGTLGSGGRVVPYVYVFMRGKHWTASIVPDADTRFPSGMVYVQYMQSLDQNYNKANHHSSPPLASPASETLSSSSTLVLPCEPSIAKAPRQVILLFVSRPPTRLPS